MRCGRETDQPGGAAGTVSHRRAPRVEAVGAVGGAVGGVEVHRPVLLWKHQGGQEVFSNPIEQAYYETLIDHLNKKLPSHPEGISGQLRLQVKIEYSAIITSVTIIDHSGNSATNDWAIRAMLSVSPVPAVPPELAQPYYFRPTLVLTK